MSGKIKKIKEFMLCFPDAGGPELSWRRDSSGIIATDPAVCPEAGAAIETIDNSGISAAATPGTP